MSNNIPSIKPTNNNITHPESDSTVWIILPILFVTIVGTLYAYYRYSNGASKIYHSTSSNHSHGDDSIVNNDFTAVVIIDDNDNSENESDDDGDDECSNSSDSTEDLEPLFRISRVPVVAVATASEVSTLPTAVATIDGDILYLDLSAIVRN